MLPMTFNRQRIFAYEVFSAVVNPCYGQKRGAAGARSRMEFANTMDSLIGLNPDIVESISRKDSYFRDFHLPNSILTLLILSNCRERTRLGIEVRDNVSRGGLSYSRPPGNGANSTDVHLFSEANLNPEPYLPRHSLPQRDGGGSRTLSITRVEFNPTFSPVEFNFQKLQEGRKSWSITCRGEDKEDEEKDHLAVPETSTGPTNSSTGRKLLV